MHLLFGCAPYGWHQCSGQRSTGMQACWQLHVTLSLSTGIWRHHLGWRCRWHNTSRGHWMLSKLISCLQVIVRVTGSEVEQSDGKSFARWDGFAELCVLSVNQWLYSLQHTQILLKLINLGLGALGVMWSTCYGPVSLWTCPSSIPLAFPPESQAPSSILLPKASQLKETLCHFTFLHIDRLLTIKSIKKCPWTPSTSV